VKGKTENGIWPNMTQAGGYGATLHYLKAVADMGVPAARADGRAVVERMKRIPTDDGCFGPGRIRGTAEPCIRFACSGPRNRQKASSRGTWRSLQQRRLPMRRGVRSAKAAVRWLKANHQLRADTAVTRFA
jgi:hypothetical protein